MRILVTGACGHIGSYIIENIYKIKKVKKIILVDNFLDGKIHSIFNLKDRKKFIISSKDLTIKNSLNSFKKIDIIIHCASITNAAGSFYIKDKMKRIFQIQFKFNDLKISSILIKIFYLIFTKEIQSHYGKS